MNTNDGRAERSYRLHESADGLYYFFVSLQEIEAAVSNLSSEELEKLTEFLSSFTRERANGTRTFKGAEAIAWWHETEHLGSAEADAFAADVASARAEVRPPVSRWD